MNRKQFGTIIGTIFVLFLLIGAMTNFNQLTLSDDPEITGANGETLSNATNDRWTSSGDMNVASSKKYLINGTQIAASNLSDGANIAHINAIETVSVNWVYNSTITVASNVFPKITVLTDTTATGKAYTAANMVGGLILRDPNGGNISDTTATAASLIAAIPSAGNGASFDLIIKNTADSSETITVVGGTGVTVTGTATIAQNNTKIFKCVTNQSDTTAVLYSIGTLTH